MLGLTCTHVGGGSGGDCKMRGWAEVGRGAGRGQVEGEQPSLRDHRAAMRGVRAAPHAHQHVALAGVTELYNNNIIMTELSYIIFFIIRIS